MLETSNKSVEMRDGESVFRPEGMGGSDKPNPDSLKLDLNVDVGPANCIDGDDYPACVDESNNLPVSEKVGRQHNDGLTKARGFDLDLNAAEFSISNNESFHPYKMHQQWRSRDDSDCVSSVGPLVGKDPMRVWNGLKRNNYMSSPYGAPPASLRKSRGRKKSNHDVMKRKIELAKKEQVDEFAKVAAPCGLLNGLNPGIINHVRNRKQVHSIIEALVKSERNENLLSDSEKRNHTRIGARELSKRKEAINVYGSGGSANELSNEDAFQVRSRMQDYAFFSKSMHPNKEFARGEGGSHMEHTRASQRLPLWCGRENEDGRQPLRLSSSVAAGAENASCLSTDDSAENSCVTSLSVKAAIVASQWLDLLNQDIRGRLAALRRSKKRVRSVITTELPLLMSGEFSSDLDKDSQTINSSPCLSDQAAADAHSVKWNTLFAQMDTALCEEETYLENWLNQVKEMQMHCEMGLNGNSLQTGNASRSGAEENLDKDLAVRAAAASIYSTCNFLLSKENLPCC